MLPPPSPAVEPAPIPPAANRLGHARPVSHAVRTVQKRDDGRALEGQSEVSLSGLLWLKSTLRMDLSSWCPSFLGKNPEEPFWGLFFNPLREANVVNPRSLRDSLSRAVSAELGLLTVSKRFSVIQGGHSSP